LLEDDAGLRGIGEATPLPGYSPESPEQCKEALCAVVNAIPNAEIDDTAPPLVWLPALLHPVSASAPSVGMALDTALVDLCAKQRGVPAHRWLNAAADCRQIHLNATIDLTREDRAMALSLETLVSRGFSVFKIKLKHNTLSPHEERRRLAFIRNLLGDTAELRLDANGDFPPAQMNLRVDTFLMTGISYIEEPGPVEQWSLIRRAGLHVGADESLQESAMRQRIFAEGLADVVILKPATLGGLAVSFHIATAAFQCGMGVVVTHLFDGPVALAACRTLAFSLPRQPLACGLAAHEGLFAWEHVPARMREPTAVLNAPLRSGLAFGASSLLNMAVAP
jgi:L-alanine-DL-glutamate epimerase-like enolase superfamily enzyme